MNANKKKRGEILILIIDDSITQLTELKYILENAGFTVVHFINPILALKYLKNKKDIIPDVIITDIVMPEMDGFEFCKQVKNDDLLKKIPLIFLTCLDDNFNHKKGLELGAVDYILKPLEADFIKVRLDTHIDLEMYRNHLEEMIEKKTAELEQIQQVTIECIASLAEYRDNETGQHIRRTQEYIQILAIELKKNPEYENLLTKKEIKLLCQSAPLHDIGKVGIPDSILLKPGKLTDEEFEIMKTHAEIGRKTLDLADKKMQKESFLHHAAEMAGYHHERWDGKGYPEGLKGKKIPLFARLMAIVDVYDALISKRVYKDPVTHKNAVETIMEGANSLFDPDIVKAFANVEKKFKEIAEKYSDYR